MADGESLFSYALKRTGEKNESTIQKIQIKDAEQLIDLSYGDGILSNKRLDELNALSFSFGLSQNLQPFIIKLDKTVNVFNFVDLESDAKRLTVGIISSILAIKSDFLLKLVLCAKKSQVAIFDGEISALVNNLLTDEIGILAGLEWLFSECKKRKELIVNNCCQDFDEYNKKQTEKSKKLPKIIYLVDQFDLFCFTDNEKSIIENVLTSISNDFYFVGAQIVITSKKKFDLFAVEEDKCFGLDKNDFFISKNSKETFQYLVVRPNDTSSQNVDCNFVKNLSRIDKKLINENNKFNDKISKSICKNSKKFEQSLDDEIKLFDNYFYKDNVYYAVLEFCLQNKFIYYNEVVSKFKLGQEKANDVFSWLRICNFIDDFTGKRAKVLISKEKFIKLFGEII